MILKGKVNGKDVYSYEGEKLPFEHYLKIDNTDLTPDAVAKMIQSHFAIPERRADNDI